MYLVQKSHDAPIKRYRDSLIAVIRGFITPYLYVLNPMDLFHRAAS